LTITCIRRFHPHGGSLILTSAMNGRINCDQEKTSMMANGWIRCASFPSPLSVIDTPNDRIRSAAAANVYRRRVYNTGRSGWLAQANDIFNRFQITKGFENFGIFPVSRSSNCADNFPSINIWYRLPSHAFWTNRQFIFWLPLFVPLDRAPSRRPDILPNS
jgi:hypothetical protein